MNFPALCIDNFYNNPDKIREFALSLEYKKQPGNYPGFRTNPLYDIDYDFFNESLSKIFSVLFNYDYEEVKWNVTSYFQKIYPYSEDKNSPLNSGWFHEDGDGGIAAGIIYLNPHSNLDSGTTIGELKSNSEQLDNYSWRDLFYSGEEIDRLQYQYKLIEHNSKFNKTIEFKNVYNRLILYDASNWHRESNFFASENEPRLTQVFFVHDLCVSNNCMPIQKVRSFNI